MTSLPDDELTPAAGPGRRNWSGPGQPGRRRTVHEQGGLAGCWPRSRHGREEFVTDVIDGPSGANGQPGRKDERESFSTMTVGNSPGRDAQALTPTISRPWATRQM